MRYLFVVLMQRWGSEESHHYIEGVYSSLDQAQKQGELEKERRDGKYDYKIEEVIENEDLTNRRDRLYFEKKISKQKTNQEQ